MKEFKDMLNERTFLMGIVKLYHPDPPKNLWELTGDITEKQYRYILALHYQLNPDTANKIREILIF